MPTPIRLLDYHTPTYTNRARVLSDNDFFALCMALDSETGRSFPIPVYRFVGENFATAIIKYRIRSLARPRVRRVTRYVVATRILVNHGGNCASSDHPPHHTASLRLARSHVASIHAAFGVRSNPRSRVPYHVAVATTRDATRRLATYPREVDTDDVRCAVCGEHEASSSTPMLCTRCASQGRDAATGEL